MKFTFLLLLYFIPVFNTSFNSIEKWDEDNLFEYIKYHYLTPDNKTNEIKAFNYILIDPNEYLSNIKEIKRYLDKLYNEYNITSFIYIINHLKKNINLNYKLKDFNTKVFSEIKKYTRNNFDEYSTISLIFQVEDDKMNIRLGSNIRNIISDSEALEILKLNSHYLFNKQLNILLKNFFSSFINKYTYNYKQNSRNNNFNFFAIILTIKGILLLSLIIIIYFILIYFCLIHKNKTTNVRTEMEKNIEKFIRVNKDEQIEKVMNNFCIICLHNYDSDNNGVLNIEENEKINLPCRHSFHQRCIYKLFKLKENKECIICKTKYKIKSNDKKEQIDIKDYTLNKKFDYNDINSNYFDCYIKEFINIQKDMNSFDIKNEFCDYIIKIYYNQSLDNSTVKIKNY